MRPRRSRIALLCGVLALFCLSLRGATPNVIVILADDLGWTDLSCYGSTFYETPNIDRLARDGMKFTQAYSACTVCSPTRAALLTGEYPARLHITDWIPGLPPENPKLLVPPWTRYLPVEEMTIARALRAKGYTTASIGKWHLGSEDLEKHGFETNIAGTSNAAPPSYFAPYKIATLPEGAEGEYLTDRLGDEAARFIERNADKPFFLYLPHFAVHTPIQGKKELIQKYRTKLRPGQKQTNAVYAAMIESLDDAVGRVRRKLDDLKLADRTVVIFTSDNGGRVPTTSNHPLRVGKGSCYEGGTRVPLIVSWPGVTKGGSVSDTPVITSPGDLIVPSSYNTPQSEQVENAIDNQPTKYLNFDKLNTGFTVSPRVGSTVLDGLSLTSANDHPERDPASYVLSGSLDGTNFNGISSGPVPPFTNRFQKQTILFSNEIGYLHYRLIFPTLVDATTAVAMHISEVELLTNRDRPGPTSNCPPHILIHTQPEDTPVLLGARATFRMRQTGPWQLQWYRNGVAVAGATSSTYVTPPAVASDDGARFHVRVTNNVCWVESDEVILSIFTPSTTESIGLTWLGQGGGGGPVPMLPEDITGVFPQAYWNNLPGRTNTLTQPLSSSNQAHPTITVQWATSGEWQTGVADQYPDQRLFDGICTSYGTNENTAQTVTLSNVPPGYHSVLLYVMQRALEFSVMDFQVLTFHSNGTQKAMARRFIRPQNGDEYFASRGFVLVHSETPATRAVGNTMWLNNLHPEDGRIQVRFFSPGRALTNAFGDPARGPGLSGLQLLLNPPVLSTAMTPSNELLISWPAAAAEFLLEATDELNPPDWRLVGPIPIASGDRFEVRLPASKPQEYYRLRQ